jgi:hypothetical protein
MKRLSARRGGAQGTMKIVNDWDATPASLRVKFSNPVPGAGSISNDVTTLTPAFAERYNARYREVFFRPWIEYDKVGWSSSTLLCFLRLNDKSSNMAMLLDPDL